MSICNLIIKAIFLLIFTFSVGISMAQPPYPPLPFEDSYRGKADLVLKAAKVKTQRTYYKLEEGNEPNILYNIREYNIKGYLTNQIWYNLLSKKEMYSAHYEYDNDDYFTSCVEKITKEFDDFQYFSKKIGENSMFANFIEYPNGEAIPVDKESNVIIKTFYKKDSLGGYIAKKYFYDGSFYKEKVCSFQEYGHQPYANLYLNKNKSIDFIYSDSYYITDTLYQSPDTLNIRVQVKENNTDCFRILKIKHGNEFIITEIDKILVKTKFQFSYINFRMGDNIKNLLNSITYLTYDINSIDRLILLHKIQNLDDSEISLSHEVELKEIDNHDYFVNIKGALYYTSYKNGELYTEEHYAIGNNLQKLRDVFYTNHNLIKEKTYYSACYELETFSKAFNYKQKNSVEEIYEYEYFD